MLTPQDPDVDSLEDLHVSLMRLYLSALSQTTAAPYFRIAGHLPTSASKPSRSGLRGLLALFAIAFTFFIPGALLEGLSKLQAHLPAVLAPDVERVGMKCLTWFSYILFTLAWLNVWLQELIALNFAVLPRLIRPAVRNLSAYFIREHVRSQLEKLACAYRARIAAHLIVSEQTEKLRDLAEEITELRTASHVNGQFLKCLGSLFLSESFVWWEMDTCFGWERS